MDPERRPQAQRDHFTVMAESIGDDAWHLTVRELPATWTVAFATDELEGRARQRIALDLGVEPTEFDLSIVHGSGLFLERRATHRDRGS